MSDEHARLALCDVRGPFTDLMEKLDGDDGQTVWLPAFKRFLRKENPWPDQTKHPSRLKVLRRHKKIVTLPAINEPFDPNQFFQTGSGLYVWDDFQIKIVAHAKPVESVPGLNISTFALAQNAAYDSQIRLELPEGHVFTDPSIFCCHLAGMIKCQTGGKRGPLLSNGYADLFYVEVAGGVFVVSVRWNAGAREWRVAAFRLDDYVWDAGDRVFSAAAVA